MLLTCPISFYVKINPICPQACKVDKMYNFATLQLKHWDTFKQDIYSTVEGDGVCRVGKVRTSTTSGMPDHKGFKLQ